MELKVLLQKELEENPALEESRETEAPLEQESGERETPSEEELRFDEAFDKLLKLEDSWKESFYQEPSDKYTPDQESKRTYLEGLITKPKTLQGCLLEQLSLMDLKEVEKRIGEAIIGNIDEDGYLRTDVDTLAKDCNAPLPLVQRLLFLIQSFDPPGVGARSLEETLLIQVRGRRKVNQLAREIIKGHLKNLQRKRYSRISKSLGVSIEQVTEATKLISRLEPKPGRKFSQEPLRAIVPDIILERTEDKLTIVINDEDLPPLRISSLYKKLMKKKDLSPSTRAYIKDKIKAGLWLIRAIEQRRSTIQKIAQEILRHQSGFLKEGEPLGPLRLKDIAERCGIHPSTVSRAIANKYIQTPKGIMAMRELFSGKVETRDGRLESQKGLKERIATLIAEEDRQRPLSDTKIAEILSKEGYKIARRTVNKYRDELKILPASLRKS